MPLPSTTHPPHAPRTVRARALAALIALAALTACPPQPPITTGNPTPAPADDPRTAQALQAARDQLDRGAPLPTAALARIVADHPNTASAATAALLLHALGARQGDPAAIDALAALADDPNTPADARRAAASYLALARLSRGDDRDATLAQLAQAHPDAQPSALLIATDRPSAAALLALARLAHSPPPQALRALSWAHQLAASPSDRRHAIDRAFALARAASATLAPLADDPDDFVSGFASLALAWTDDPPPDRAQAAQARLTRIGAPHLADELAQRLQQAKRDAPLRVGLLLPLSGPTRPVGRSALAAAMLAAGTDGSGEHPNVTWLVHDTRSDPAQAAAGVEALHASGAALILGPIDNAEAAAAAAHAERLRLPLVALSLDPNTERAGPHVFRRSIDPPGELAALLALASRTGASRLAVLYPDAPFGRAALAQAEDATRDSPVSLVARASYSPNAADFSAQARALKRARPDAVFIPDVAPNVAKLLPFLAAEDLWCTPPDRWRSPPHHPAPPLLCMGNAAWLQGGPLTSTYAQGAVIATSYDPDHPSPQHRRFARAYRAHTGRPPDLFAAHAFDAATVAARLLQRHGPDRAALTRALSALRDAPGLQGPITATPHGALLHAPELMTLRDGTPERLPTQP